MKNFNSVRVEAQGAETQSVPDLSSIDQWLIRDLQCAITLLTAIVNDKPLRDLMGVHLQGRIVNHVNKPVDDPAQSTLFGK